MGETYYDLLDISRDASTEDVEAAYREQVKETHPDRSDAPDASERFKAITRARNVLSDPQKRAQYDRLGHEGFVNDGPRFSFSTHERSTPEARRQDPGQEPPGDGSDGTASRTAENTDTTAGGPTGDTTRTDGFGSPADRRGGRDANGSFTREHASQNRSRSWYRPGADGSDGYRVSTRDDTGVRFTTERIAVAVVAFALYPILVAGAFLPTVPLLVNVLVGLCSLAVALYLLTVPETGVLVFGGWTLVAPFALAMGGVSLLSGFGILAWAFCWIPFSIAFANLLFRSR